MDDIVIKAMAKWPQVPACTGWLGLDARGQWWMRDDQAQACGAFSSGKPGCKGSLLTHEKLMSFIGRNYMVEESGVRLGQWYFQNGPQRVYVELEATPWVWRIQPDFSIRAHTGNACKPQRCVVDEYGAVYLETELGFGLIHTQDMLQAADALEGGLWVALQVPRSSLPERFGYTRSPAQAALVASDVSSATRL
jgi:Protein of unknown function (DUF2946)